MKIKDKKICKICGNVIANPDNKTGICPRCSGKGGKIAAALGGIISVIIVWIKRKNSK